MKDTLLITKIEQNSKTFIATSLYHDHTLLELNLESLEHQSILNNIYVGRVKDIVKNLNAAFIEIAPGHPCYYSLEEKHNPIFVKKINSPRLVQGDEVVVQITKENMKTKPPKVSTSLSFTGKYLVLTTENTSIGISRKLDIETRERLKQWFLPFQNNEFGIIVRTSAAQATIETIQQEYEVLEKEFLHLKETAPHRTCFTCLRHALPEYLHFLQSAVLSDVDHILTDDVMIFESVQDYLKIHQPLDASKLVFYQDNLLSLNKLYSLEVKLKEALQTKVWLKSGGYLVIQPTEALTVIDVNSGKSIAKKNVQEHHLKINLEAANEIAHQLRLRNISGIIIIDFISMTEMKFKLELMQVLRKLVSYDSVPVQIIDMTKLDLVEITRKKIKKSLAEQYLPDSF